MPDTPANQIDASPTKELFIEMLTRDVPLLWAILDVVDNSVDAAKAKAKAAGGDDLSPYHVKITLNNEFLILDNCGGLSRSDALSHAFRFGRDADNPATPFSVGQFGVGMKRTLFKLGKHFCVDSLTDAESFRVEVDVPEWRKEAKWLFPIKDTPGSMQLNRPGLRIRVDNLHEFVVKAFSDQVFINGLREEIQRAHFINLARGLFIEVNGVALKVPDIGLKSASGVVPFHRQLDYDIPDQGTVAVEIWAGVGERDPDLAGWYVFCNERMVLAADQGLSTGWGEGGGRTVPRFHNDFAYFRGYVMFSASEPKLLPWTSMKTGIDTDSKVFVQCRQEMITAMRPVTKALRDLAKEKSERKAAGLSVGRLETAVEEAVPTRLSQIVGTLGFAAPLPELPDQLVETEAVYNIQYQRPREDVDKAKVSLGVDSAKAVGEKTFDYYLKYGM